MNRTSSGPVKFKVTHKQAEFLMSPEQFVAGVGGGGGPKSTALIIKGLLHSQESPGNLGVIVRKEFTSLRDSTIKDFETYSGFKVAEQKKECTLPNGSVILFRHADELPVLKNLNLGWFGIEQAEELPDATAWNFLVMRLRRDVKKRTGFLIANTNGHNWIWSMFKKDGPPQNHKLIECNTYEHIADAKSLGVTCLPDDYVENMERILPKKLFNRFVMNSWDEAEGLVYDEFAEAKHVIDPYTIPDGWVKGFVLDHGFRNPTAVLWYAIDFDGNVILYDEHYQAEKVPSFHAEQIKRRGVEGGYADPSIFSKTIPKGGTMYSIADEYYDQGINLIPAFRSKEEASIARVNEHFKAGRIKIFCTLKNTINEISNWKWKEVKPGLNAKEEPQDLNNHLCDCLKYLIATRFSSPVNPNPAPESRSLAWYEKLEEKVGFLRKRRHLAWR